MISQEQCLALVGQVIDIIRRHIPDRDTLRRHCPRCPGAGLSQQRACGRDGYAAMVVLTNPTRHEKPRPKGEDTTPSAISVPGAYGSLLKCP